MKTLNLINQKDSDIDYEMFTFPDGQPHIKIQPPKKYINEVRIVARIASPSDLLLVLCAQDVLERLEVQRTELFCSYLLGARMDRVMSLGEPFTLKVILGLLSGFTKVEVFDPHSEATSQINSWPNVSSQSNSKFVGEVLELISIRADTQGKDIILVSPDEGASSKTGELSRRYQLPWTQALKVRDPETGRLSAPTVDLDDFKGANVLIVDDICDGGGTFIQLAEVLKQKNAGKLFLVVSHGIFSKGISPLVINGFEQIYTTNSYQDFKVRDNKLTVINLW
jgi:ribose-phosphate pyrophosphokinase